MVSACVPANHAQIIPADFGKLSRAIQPAMRRIYGCGDDD